MSRLTSVLARLAPIALCAVAASACVSPHGDTVAEQRDSVDYMRETILEQAYADDPAIEQRVKNAAGYAVFDTGVAKILIVGTANGYGMVVNNATGAETIVDHFSIALGPGIELSNTRGLAILESQAAVDAALSGEWNFGGAAQLGFRFGNFGGGVGGADLGGGMENHRYFQSGIAIHASLIWVDVDRDDHLN